MNLLLKVQENFFNSYSAIQAMIFPYMVRMRIFIKIDFKNWERNGWQIINRLKLSISDVVLHLVLRIFSGALSALWKRLSALEISNIWTRSMHRSWRSVIFAFRTYYYIIYLMRILFQRKYSVGCKFNSVRFNNLFPKLNQL